MNEKRTTFFSSVISEIQQSDLYLTIKARLFETPAANLNGVRVTSDFIDDIIANEDKYITQPLYADVKNLAQKAYDDLGHLYNARTGKFGSTQIGSFYKFEKEVFDGGAYLVGYARVLKRDKAVSNAIMELFASNKLKFSFEISCGEYVELDDGTIQIDASNNNYLEGVAVVTYPACESAEALELVAQNDERKDDHAMTDEVKAVEQTAEEIVAEAEVVETAEQSTEIADAIEEVASSETVETAEEETSECKKKSEEENSECKKKAEEETSECKKESAEEDSVSSECKKQEDEMSEEESAACKKKCAETVEDKVAELSEQVAKLTQLVAELTEQKKEVKQEIAEKKTDEEINPFMAEISSEKHYSLLESAKPKYDSFTLLNRF